MAFGKDIFCRGIDVYNLCDTDETSVSVTTYVGHSMSTGPKVAIRRNRPFRLAYTEEDEQVIGTIDASIFMKNSNQDNFKYLTRKLKRKSKMETPSPVDVIKAAIGNGKDVIGIITLTDTLLGIIEDGTMTVKDVRESLSQLKESISSENVLVEVEVGNSGIGHHADSELDDELDGETCVVRRLTPTETSRLQGFPDDYTKIEGPETADAPQFKSHGNSWATPCANFVSTRMEMELRRLGHEGTIRYATCCSGIEAHSVSVRNLDWKAVFFSEIEPFPCRVLEKHYPDVPNLGDMTQIHYDESICAISNAHKEGEEYSLPSCFKEAPIQTLPFKIGELEVFSGGTPCQSVSVAGKREGMAEGSGTRSSLAFHFQRIIDECRPTFTIWENVPGAFSSNGGADFIWFVNRCAESGYAMAWRVLDAQFTMTEEFPRAVPQRRRRIWLVGYKGNDWRIPSRIVFETEKALTENPPKRIPGIGFKTINKDADIEAIRNANKSKDETVANDGFLDLFASIEDTGPKAKKVSKMIPLDEFPSNGDFSKVRMVDVYEFAKKVGEPGFLGDVFRKDKKTAEVAFKQLPEYKDDFEWQQSDEARALYSKLVELEKSGELKWEGAELISPQILENIGNSGILSNGRVLTMNCHEWTSGIQLSPKTYSAWEVVMQHMDWLKANDLLPEAYDETVCGLSDVLEEDPDEKYNLSWRACFGILRRAETRGKELPPALYIALISTIRNNAGIVKWVAINGRDTKKKETDMSEREIAKLCFDKYISSVVSFDDVVAVQPNRKSEDEEEDEDDSCDDIEVDEDGNPILPEEDFGISDKETDAIIDSAAECKMSRVTRVNGIIKESAIVDMPDLPNGVINVGGGETAATLIASGDAAVGTTQDSNVIALKK